MTQTLTLRRPDDWHLHLRDGAMLKAVLPETTRHFARAIIMPNLVPPVVTKTDAESYKARIMAAMPEGASFQPLMTLYLTEETDPDDLAAAHASGLISAVKLYPAGATTNSASGVQDFDKVRPVFERMAEIGCPLCVHGEVTDREIDIFDREAIFIDRVLDPEVTDREIDIFDREAIFIDRVLDPIRRAVPELKVIMEHITTKDGADYVAANAERLGATITVQHLMFDRNDMLVGGMRPHYYCLPILKRREHREALLKAATSGDPRYFLGTDSAPHPTHAKEAECCAAGCFTAPIALSCLAETFEAAGALDKLEGFTSLHGPAFYGLEPNDETITLTKGKPISYPEKLTAGDHTVTVFNPGVSLHWTVSA